ncbi:toll/interleukin-1 receptor domain-containing protein [Bradyrhizobium sp. Leo170]|uniref:toll/interleukin-1 receptor domain-containing protein n=1 Tax=Bradyrhizobium sp. Leo170 TaxID=1571199 RepID=UPI00102E4E11|nr:toll/interleukin-1 receptor domain-containing protein [Bradyrhizobium sp. Leo170]TAI62076.1 toll/interleukin-1 receptor domain-containing protein [Bradyrhizobium sp. Leo170]
MSKAFISYSHRDEKALQRLHVHLATLRREKKISAWYDREILAGASIDDEIILNLSEADIFLPLVSPDFLASNYCYEQEMERALERHAASTLRVIPVILEPCDWKSTPLSKLKALPKDGIPISTWTNENVAYLDVVTELRRLCSTQKPSKLGVADEGESPPMAPPREPRRYRLKKEFDAIDRDEFREQAFRSIRDFFRQSIDELNGIDDSIRARFEQMNDLSFSCTILNKGNRDREAHITIHADTGESFGGEISYSYGRRAPANTANGFVYVMASEYELYLRLDTFMTRSRDDEQLSAAQVADALWREFTSQAGIDHE